MTTNLLVAPNDFTDPAWGAGGGAGTVAPHTLTDLDPSNVFFVGQAVAVPINMLPYTFVFEVLKTSGAANFPALDMRATALLTAIVINTDLGTIVDRVGWSPTSSGIIDRGTHWLAWITNNNNGGNSFSVLVEPAFNADASGSASVGAEGPATFRNGQFIQGTSPATAGGQLLMLF